MLTSIIKRHAQSAHIYSINVLASDQVRISASQSLDMSVRIEGRRLVSAEGVGDVWGDVSLIIICHLVLFPTMDTGLSCFPARLWSPGRQYFWNATIAYDSKTKTSAPATCQSMSQIRAYEVSPDIICATWLERDWEHALLAKNTYTDVSWTISTSTCNLFPCLW